MPIPALRMKDGKPGFMGGIKPAWSHAMQQSGFGFVPVFPIDIQQFLDGRDVLRILMNGRSNASQSFG